MHSTNILMWKIGLVGIKCVVSHYWSKCNFGYCSAHEKWQIEMHSVPKQQDLKRGVHLFVIFGCNMFKRLSNWTNLIFCCLFTVFLKTHLLSCIILNVNLNPFLFQWDLTKLLGPKLEQLTSGGSGPPKCIERWVGCHCGNTAYTLARQWWKTDNSDARKCISGV